MEKSSFSLHPSAFTAMDNYLQERQVPLADGYRLLYIWTCLFEHAKAAELSKGRQRMGSTPEQMFAREVTNTVQRIHQNYVLADIVDEAAWLTTPQEEIGKRIMTIFAQDMADNFMIEEEYAEAKRVQDEGSHHEACKTKCALDAHGTCSCIGLEDQYVECDFSKCRKKMLIQLTKKLLDFRV